MLAASGGHLEMIDLLLSVGAEVNRTGVSRYMQIQSSGSKGTVWQKCCHMSRGGWGTLPQLYSMLCSPSTASVSTCLATVIITAVFVLRVMDSQPSCGLQSRVKWMQ